MRKLLSSLIGVFSQCVAFETLEEEYPPEYCRELEAAYGKGMMSEGGGPGIDHMFDGVALENKKALDIGSGLGGVAFYLAEKHNMQITGLEVNPWMVEESKRRSPATLNVDFVLSTSNENWPFPNEHFNLIYSKGVLVQIASKKEIFKECYRLLQPGCLFVIDDWLSSEQGQWGNHMARLVELENLSLYAESQSQYIQLLEDAGFTLVSVRDDKIAHREYHLSIIEGLKQSNHTEFDRNAAIEGYESILKALEIGELKAMRFIAQKR